LSLVVRHLPAEYWDAECAAGNVVDMKHQPVAAEQIVRSGQRYLHRLLQQKEPDVRAAFTLLHEDAAIVVLDKPAPLPVHPAGRYSRNTLQHLLELLYHPQKPRAAHRLDANTTGVMVVARTRHFAGRLQPQFAAGQVHKSYLALVRGHPPSDSFTCDAPIGSAPGVLGTRDVDEQGGLAAVTHFQVLERRSDGTTLMQIHPETGRTNQIRLHCAHMGFAIVGDQAYGRGVEALRRQTTAVGDAPLCLHAWQLQFRHPANGETVCFAAPAPIWSGSLAGRVPPGGQPSPHS
jgi:RluA family pseudouridine synthase